MLAADYSQLELRLLAHLAKDRCLMSILNSGSDVFKQIAAKWKHVDVESVSAEQRQQAKQVSDIIQDLITSMKGFMLYYLFCTLCQTSVNIQCNEDTKYVIEVKSFKPYSPLV